MRRPPVVRRLRSRSANLTAPATGAVSVRTSGRRSSDWDVGLVDRATGNVLNGAAARGSSDYFEALVAKGQRLALQGCRLSGGGGLNIRVRFARAATGGSTGIVRMARVNLATRLDADRLAALGLDTTDHAGDSHQDVLLHSRADEQRLRSAGFSYRVVQADQLRHDAANRRREARAQARVLAARRLGPARAAQAASALPSGRASYRTLANINDELRALAQANPNLVRLFSIGTSRLGKPIQGIEIATNVGAADGRPGYVQIGDPPRARVAGQRGRARVRLRADQRGDRHLEPAGRGRRPAPADRRRGPHVRDPGAQRRRLRRDDRDRGAQP